MKLDYKVDPEERKIPFEIDDISEQKNQLSLLKSKIDEVEACIEKVGVDIEYALQNIKVPDQLGVDYWIAEKDSLRAKEQCLMNKEQSLRAEKQLLLGILSNKELYLLEFSKSDIFPLKSYAVMININL